MTPPQPMIASLHRRLRFANSWRYRLDAGLAVLGCRRNRWLSRIYSAGNLAFDLLEFARTGGRPSHPGRAHLAVLTASVRLPQDPRYRGYWYDPTSHSLVGMHLGLDLHRYRSKYYVIESNVAAAMRPERRLLYDSDLDPLLSPPLSKRAVRPGSKPRRPSFRGKVERRLRKSASATALRSQESR